MLSQTEDDHEAGDKQHASADTQQTGDHSGGGDSDGDQTDHAGIPS